jgi:hypothetical protein
MDEKTTKQLTASKISTNDKQEPHSLSLAVFCWYDIIVIISLQLKYSFLFPFLQAGIQMTVFWYKFMVSGHKLNWKGTSEERFWNFIKRGKKDDCWGWVGGKTKDGYGHFSVNKKSVLSHRFSYELHFGKIIDDMSVLHRCDNPPCCNPEHLFLGTQKDNMQDCKKKGRIYVPDICGEQNGRSKLSYNKVNKIREIFLSKEYSQRKIAEKFNISFQSVWSICHGKIWK